MYDPEREEMEIEWMSKLGDPRRCPRHPHIKTSSPDGMHDAPCGLCEAELDDLNRFGEPMTQEQIVNEIFNLREILWETEAQFRNAERQVEIAQLRGQICALEAQLPPPPPLKLVPADLNRSDDDLPF